MGFTGLGSNTLSISQKGGWGVKHACQSNQSRASPRAVANVFIPKSSHGVHEVWINRRRPVISFPPCERGQPCSKRCIHMFVGRYKPCNGTLLDDKVSFCEPRLHPDAPLRETCVVIRLLVLSHWQLPSFSCLYIQCVYISWWYLRFSSSLAVFPAQFFTDTCSGTSKISKQSTVAICRCFIFEWCEAHKPWFS